MFITFISTCPVQFNHEMIYYIYNGYLPAGFSSAPVSESKMCPILVLNLAQNILDLLFHGEPPSWYNPVSAYHNHSFSPEKSCFANFLFEILLCFSLTFSVHKVAISFIVLLLFFIINMCL